MSLRIVYEERSIDQAAGYLDDPDGIRAVLAAVDRLVDDPRPPGSPLDRQTFVVFASDDTG